MYRWPTHVISPNTTDYSVNWRSYLAGSSINSVLWEIKVDGVYVPFNNDDVVDGLNKLTESFTPNVATLYVNGGERNKDYYFRCTVTATGRPSKSVEIQLRAQ